MNLMCAVLGASLLFFIAAIMCFEVAVRATGGASRLWVIEVSEYALLFITFLGAPYLLEKNMHVVLDLVYDSIPHGTKFFVRLWNAGIGFATCAVLAAVGFGVVIEQFNVGVREVTVMRPESWWITAAVPIGAGLMSIQFLDQIVQTLQGERS
jgi:C4-dicarboxylate transporter, DctQ subunit